MCLSCAETITVEPQSCQLWRMARLLRCSIPIGPFVFQKLGCCKLPCACRLECRMVPLCAHPRIYQTWFSSAIGQAKSRERMSSALWPSLHFP